MRRKERERVEVVGSAEGGRRGLRSKSIGPVTTARMSAKMRRVVAWPRRDRRQDVRKGSPMPVIPVEQVTMP